MVLLGSSDEARRMQEAEKMEKHRDVAMMSDVAITANQRKELYSCYPYVMSKRGFTTML